MNAYIQHIDDFPASAPPRWEDYHVVPFSGMPPITPSDEDQPWWAGTPRAAMESLGGAGQGILLLYHGLLAYRDWFLRNRLVGIDDRRFGYSSDQAIRVDMTSRHHPITEGLEA